MVLATSTLPWIIVDGTTRQKFAAGWDVVDILSNWFVSNSHMIASLSVAMSAMLVRDHLWTRLPAIVPVFFTCCGFVRYAIVVYELGSANIRGYGHFIKFDAQASIAVEFLVIGLASLGSIAVSISYASRECRRNHLASTCKTNLHEIGAWRHAVRFIGTLLLLIGIWRCAVHSFGSPGWYLWEVPTRWEWDKLDRDDHNTVRRAAALDASLERYNAIVATSRVQDEDVIRVERLIRAIEAEIPKTEVDRDRNKNRRRELEAKVADAKSKELKIGLIAIASGIFALTFSVIPLRRMPRNAPATN